MPAGDKEELLEEPEMLLNERFRGGEDEHPPPLVVDPGGCYDEGNRGLPEARGEDHHRIPLEGMEGDRELEAPLLEALGTDEGMGDVLHGPSDAKAMSPLMRPRTVLPRASFFTLTWAMLSLSRMVTVPSSMVW